MDPALVVSLALLFLCGGLLVLMARLVDAMRAQEQGEERRHRERMAAFGPVRALATPDAAPSTAKSSHAAAAMTGTSRGAGQGGDEDETDTVIFVASERAPRSGVEPPRSVTVVSRT